MLIPRLSSTKKCQSSDIDFKAVKHSSIQPRIWALAALCAAQHPGWKSNPPPTQSSTHTPLTHQRFKQQPRGICRLLRVSHGLGCNQLVYSERRKGPTTASCSAPFEQIRPMFATLVAHFPLLLIAHSLDPPQLLSFSVHSLFQHWFLKKKKRMNIVASLPQMLNRAHVYVWEPFSRCLYWFLNCSWLLSSQSQCHTYHTGVQLPACIKFKKQCAIRLVIDTSACVHSFQGSYLQRLRLNPTAFWVISKIQ